MIHRFNYYYTDAGRGVALISSIWLMKRAPDVVAGAVAPLRASFSA